MTPVTCPHCQKPLNVRPELSGKMVKCPACNTSFQIPQLAQPAISPAVPPIIEATVTEPTLPEPAARTMLGTAVAILNQPISGQQVWDRFKRRQMMRLYILLGLIVIVGPPLICCGGISMIMKFYTDTLPARRDQPPQARESQQPQMQVEQIAGQEGEPKAAMSITPIKRVSEGQLHAFKTDLNLKLVEQEYVIDSLNVTSGPNQLGQVIMVGTVHNLHLLAGTKCKLVVYAIHDADTYPYLTIHKIMIDDKEFTEKARPGSSRY